MAKQNKNEKGKPRKTARTTTELAKVIREHLQRLEDLGVSDEELAAALGHESGYFKRLASLAKAPGRIDAISSKNELNERNARALEGIRKLVDHDKTRAADYQGQYLQAVIEEIDSLKEHDRHTLFTIQPPLEAESFDVRMAVLRATTRGVKFRYFVPSKEAVGNGYRAITEPDELAAEGAAKRTLEDRIKTCRDVFAWLQSVSRNTAALMSTLKNDAKALDEQQGTTQYYDGLKENVEIWPMRWLWLGWNEKLVWVTKDKKDVVRKEILDLSAIANPADARAHEINRMRRWMRIRYPMAPLIVEALLRTSRAVTPLPWDEVPDVGASLEQPRA